MMKFKYTRNQVPRGTRPDFEDNSRFYLIKNVSVLNATYQIKLLTYFSKQKKKKLVLYVPMKFKTGNSLKKLMEENPNVIEIERN